MNRPNTARAVVVLLAVQIVWGLSFLATNCALKVTTPSVLLAWRFLLAFALQNLCLLTGKRRLRLRGKKVLPVILMGVMEPGLYFFFEEYGIVYTNTSFSGVMIAIVPLVTLILAAIFLKERPTLLQAASCVLSILAVAALALLGHSDGTVQPRGVVLLLGAVVTASVFTLLGRWSARAFTPFEQAYLVVAVGAVCFPAAAVAENLGALSRLIEPAAGLPFLLAVLFLGAACSVFAYEGYSYALTCLPATRVASFSSLVTVVSILAGVLILHEPFSWRHAVYSAAIILGVWGVQRFERRSEV